MMLGLFENSSFQEEVVPLQPDDLLVVYSDGITEAENAEGEEFGEHRLVALVNEHRGAAASEIMQRIFMSVELYSRGTEQADDMTLLVVRRTS